MALRKRKIERDSDQEAKKPKLDFQSDPKFEQDNIGGVRLECIEIQPRVLLSNIKNKEEMEKV